MVDRIERKYRKTIGRCIKLIQEENAIILLKRCVKGLDEV